MFYLGRWIAVAVVLSVMPCLAGSSAAADIVVPTIVVGQFSDDQRARIQDAIDEWNRALNGHVRFDVHPNTGDPRVWAVTAVMRSTLANKREALADTVTLPKGGGLVLVYLDRLGNRSLVGVMLHEFGHVLGLQHDEGHGLMSATYNPHDQKCVDYPAMAQVATLYRLPLQDLRWCGGPPASRSSGRRPAAAGRNRSAATAG